MATGTNGRPNYKDLRGVCNQLGGTTDKAAAAALRAVSE